MKEHLTNVRLKILFSILHIKQSKQNATSIAQGLHISKSTVSRAIEKFQEQGIVDEYQLKLTEEGEEIVKYYWKCKEYIKEWLKIDHQILESTAEDEAIALVLNTRKETLDSIMKEINDKKKRHIMGELDGFTHQCIDYLLEDGTYQVAFTIYKSKIKNGLIVSMANDGFIHPASLVIKNGIGMVSLTSKKIWYPLPLNKGLLSGTVDSLWYYGKDTFKKGNFTGRDWIFPTADMKFTYNKGEGVLTGNILLKLACMAGKLYMPESTAILHMSLRL